MSLARTAALAGVAVGDVAIGVLLWRQVRRNLAASRLQAGPRVELRARGGRVIALRPDGRRNVLWTGAPEGDVGFARGDRAAEGGHAASSWNVGGDRHWLAPEVRWHYRDGEWAPVPGLDGIAARDGNRLTLTADLDGTPAVVHRTVTELHSPPAGSDLSTAGYRVHAVLETDADAALWHIVQVPPPAFVAGWGTGADAVTYYGPLPSSTPRRGDRTWAVVPDGRRWKFGLPARTGTLDGEGRVVALGQGTLVSVDFTAPVGATYLDVPPGGGDATAVQIFSEARFTELEHQAPAAAREQQSEVWGWVGSQDRLEEVTQELLGVAEPPRSS